MTKYASEWTGKTIALWFTYQCSVPPPPPTKFDNMYTVECFFHLILKNISRKDSEPPSGPWISPCVLTREYIKSIFFKQKGTILSSPEAPKFVEYSPEFLSALEQQRCVSTCPLRLLSMVIFCR
jgi:hypothetical protein